MDTKFLLLWLEAPLQSWGIDSKYYVRDTLPFPSRSGILGLLLSGAGKFGEQKQLLQLMSNYSQTIFSFSKTGKPNSILTDFHMIGSGYNDKDSWENLMIPKTSLGKKAAGGSGPKITYRKYIEDGYFAVIVEIPKDKEDLFVNGLKYPVGELSLGKRCCIPTDFIFQGSFSSEDDAINKMYQITKEKDLKKILTVIDDAVEDNMEVLTVSDVPIQFGENKIYSQRQITIIRE